ncbi:MAG: urease accessory protein UreD [Pseudomonadota bacterium]
MQRSSGAAKVSTTHLEGKTRLSRLYQEGAAKIRLPRSHDGPALNAVLINTAGGMTGGDVMRWTVEIGKGGSAVVTTQACEKVYRAMAGSAKVTVNIDIHEGAALAWLPQETILYDRSALDRNLNVRMAPDAGLLLVEPLILGRAAMGETVERTHFRDRWRIRRGERLLHAEDFRLEGDVPSKLNRSTTTNGAAAFATLLFVHRDAADLVDPVRSLLGADAAASAIGSQAGMRLVVRIVAASGFALRKQLIPVIDLCNRKLTGARQGVPKLWNT